MHLDLEDIRLSLAVLEDFSEHHELDVRDTDVSGESLLLACLHSVVSLLVSNTFFESKVGILGVVFP